MQKDEEQVILNKELRLNVIGAVYLESEKGWCYPVPNCLTCEQAKSIQFKIFAISSEASIERQDCGVFDGDIWIDRLWQKPRTIGDLAGLGERLSIHQGIYNRQDEGFILAREIIDRGIFTSDPEIRDGILSLTFSSRIEPDTQKHKIVWWDKSNELVLLDIDNYEEVEQRFVWQSLLTETCTEPLVIAISYGGDRLGVWWEDERWVTLLENPSKVEQTATLIRWFKLPLLSDRYLKKVQQFAFTYPQAVLQQWLLAKTPNYQELRWCEVRNELWFSAVRKIFLTWQPTVEITIALQNKFKDEVGDPLNWLTDSIFLKLYKVDPILMYRFLKTWLKAYPDQNQVVQLLLNQFIPAVQDIVVLLQESVSVMKVDPDFLKHLINCALQNVKEIASKGCPHFESNLASALSVESFRRLLAIRILETLKGK